MKSTVQLIHGNKNVIKEKEEFVLCVRDVRIRRIQLSQAQYLGGYRSSNGTTFPE
jgi:uncharacterized protein YlzI (FlbEa/FlbD family)